MDYSSLIFRSSRCCRAPIFLSYCLLSQAGEISSCNFSFLEMRCFNGNTLKAYQKAARRASATPARLAPVQNLQLLRCGAARSRRTLNSFLVCWRKIFGLRATHMARVEKPRLHLLFWRLADPKEIDERVARDIDSPCLRLRLNSSAELL